MWMKSSSSSSSSSSSWCLGSPRQLTGGRSDTDSENSAAARTFGTVLFASMNCDHVISCDLISITNKKCGGATSIIHYLLGGTVPVITVESNYINSTHGISQLYGGELHEAHNFPQAPHLCPSPRRTEYDPHKGCSRIPEPIINQGF